MKGSFVKTLKKDLARLCNPSIKGFLKEYFFPRGNTFRYVFWFRLMQAVKKNIITKIMFGFPVYLMFRHYEYKYGIHTNTNIKVGGGLKIVHGDCVYINCREIGENFTIYQGVTTGVSRDIGDIPLIKDNVKIYANSVVCGNITLDNNCCVGANSFVNFDVESNTVVAGCPAKVIKKYN